MPPVMRIVRRLTLFTIIFIAATVAVFAAAKAFMPTPGSDIAITPDTSPLPRDRTEGGAQFDYRVTDAKTPRTYEERLTASSLAIIPERQTQPDAPIIVTEAERQPIAHLLDDFIPAWETFSPGEDTSAYRSRIQQYAVPGTAGLIAERDGANQPAEIGICATCTTGSTFDRNIAPGDLMTIRELTGDRAYVTTQGVIAYTGGSRSGQAARRTYALLLERIDGKWLVQRVAADTLGPA